MSLARLKVILVHITYFTNISSRVQGSNTKVSPPISQSNLISLTVTGTCVNNDSFRFDGQERKTCHWVRKNKNDNDERRNTYCKHDDVHINCPLSCGICCMDDASYTFVNENGDRKRCGWIANQSFRALKYCGTIHDGQALHYSCPLACAMCEKYVSLAPSATPTTSPSVSPTDQPSALPTTLPSVSLSVSPTALPSTLPTDRPSATPCTNNDNFLIDGRRWKSCLWVRKNQKKNDKLRNVLCQNENVRINCPLSCGLCCEDDAVFTFMTENRQRRNCAWIANKPDPRAKYCTTTYNGRIVQDACPLACDECNAYISLAPSASPTALPSSLPTNQPSAGPCVDSKNFRIDGEEKQSCRWLRKKKNDNDERRKEHCKKNDVRINCPFSCGLCCLDDASYTFVNENGNLSNCAWIAKRPSRALNHCNRIYNNQMVQKACPLACDDCEDFISLAPTTSNRPSVTPTDQPSFTTCVNSNSFRIGGEEKKSCHWVRKNKNDNDKRRKAQCKNKDVHLNCPFSCGLCCADDVFFSFMTEKGNRYDCAWIAKKPDIRAKHCTTTYNGRMVQDACPLACDECNEYVSLAPSATPSYAPSVSTLPSTSPSALPTSQPSSLPSAAPSLHPSTTPSHSPSYTPSTLPTTSPSALPTSQPSISPSAVPSLHPSATPSHSPSNTPSSSPTTSPTAECSWKFQRQCRRNGCEWNEIKDKCSIKTEPPTDEPASPSTSPSLPTSAEPTTNPSSSPSSPPKKQPNILVILADDVGTGDIPLYWKSGLVDMPNIQRLADMGVTFMDAHSTPLCAPSRYMLLSGNYVHRGRRPWSTWTLSAGSNQFQSSQESIAATLSKRGNYATAMYGKWHMGASVPLRKNGTLNPKNIMTNSGHDWSKALIDGPQDIGFDSSYVTGGGIQNPPYAFFRDGILVSRPRDAVLWEVGKYHMPLGLSAIKDEGEGDPNWDSTAYNMIIVNETENFIDSHMASERSNDPWFVYAALGAVHGPHSPPDHYLDGSPIAGVYNSTHMDMLYEMDRAVGSLVDIVEQRGLSKDTIIIFASDNGGERDYMNNSTSFGHESHGPLRGAKGDIYEGGHRVPMIFRYDGHFPKNERRDHLVGLNDIYRTLCDLAKVNVPHASAQDSVSFADYIYSNDNDTDLREHLATWSYVGRYAEAESIRFGNMKYVRHFNEKSTEELYDLDRDLGETNNLIDRSKYQDLIKEMREKLTKDGPCPKDHVGKFSIHRGTPRQTKKDCTYFQEKLGRCASVLEGETKCNSICGRHHQFCRSLRPGAKL